MSDPFDLSGKTAVITGSSRGIGRRDVPGQTIVADGGATATPGGI